MTVIEVDHVLCRKDDLCIQECPALLLTRDKNDYPIAIQDASNLCIDCGHCVAVCPYGALSHRLLNPEDCLKLEKKTRLSKVQLEHFLRNRRSIRQYKDLDVSKKMIKKLLYMAKYAPSARNLQPIKWIVLGDKKKVNHAATLVLDWMKVKLESEKTLHFNGIIDAWQKGKDRILRNAPVVLIGYAHKSYNYAKSDVATSISYMELTAPSYGLGTCWAGYLTTACQDYYRLKKYILLPEDHLVHGAMMAGFSNAKYYRMPERKNQDVMWL